MRPGRCACWRSAGGGPAAWIGRLRCVLVGRASARLQGEGLAFFRALILGDRGGMGPDLREAFLRSGTLHYFSISGVHVSLVAALAVRLARRAGLGLGARALVALPVAAGYCLLAGASPPALRATLMAAAALCAFPLGGRAEGMNALLLSWMVVLHLRPEALFSVGFQLSYAAAAAILLLARDLELALVTGGRPAARSGRDGAPTAEAVPAWRSLLAGSLAVTLAATAATAPLVLRHFHLVTPVGLVANLLLSPLILLALALGLATGGALLLPWGLDAAAAGPAILFSWTAGASSALAGLLARVPGGHVFLPDLPWWLAAAYGCVLLTALTARRPSLLLPLPLILAAPLLLPSPRPPGLRLDLLDVGHGLSLLLRTPSGRRALYDAGSRDRRDVGPHAIAPALRALGVGRLDRLLLSHDDADHGNAAASVIERFRVREVLSAPSALRWAPDRARAVTEGAAWREEPGITWEALGPPPGPGHLSDNDGSLVLRLRSPWGTVLLTGDIEEGGIAHLLRRLGEDRIEVLLLPHHGDHSEGLEALLDHARPRLVLASARAGSVSPRTEALVAARGLPLFCTGEDGLVTVELTALGIEARAFRSGRRFSDPAPEGR